MKVLILTEGGENIGLGHITRCTSIYQAFEEAGIESLLIVNGDQTVRDILRDKNCKVFNWLNGRETLLATVKNADIVFIDSYLADRDLYEKISNIAKTAVYFDDDVRLNYPRGFVLNGAILAEQMAYPKRKKVTYLLGAQYAPLRKEFWDVPSKPIRDNLESVMITFGGADIRNFTPKVLKLLIDTYPELLKKVIIAKSFQNTAEIERLKDSNTELIYYPSAAEMKKVMLESDIAISAGGQTLYELARIGVPTVAVAVADNQLKSILGWKKVGYIEYAGRWEDNGVIGTINQKIELLKSKSFREYKRVVGNKLIDGAGSSRIVKELLSNFYRRRLTLRKAAFVDAQDIFNLANDNIVRKSSFEPGQIEWDHHLKWLREKLRDSNCVFFIVDCLDKFAGQVRFDTISGQKEAKISISLEKHIRGLGLSPFIISKSIKELLKTCKNVDVVKAYIKDGNIPSIKSFEEAGFKFLENMRIKGCESRVYGRATEDGHK